MPGGERACPHPETNDIQPIHLTLFAVKKLLLLLLWTGICVPLSMPAQTPKKVSIEGTVTEYGSKEPIAGCVVSIPTLELWVVTDAKGRFRMPSVTTGSYTIEASCLGYEPLSYKVTVSSSIPSLSLRLKESSLQLNTVTVTAQKGRSINSSSTIDRQAMDHLQATSVKDVMQLLPGVLTSNPALTDATSNFVGIRDLNGMTSSNANSVNSSTVGVYVDGASVNNDALMVGTEAEFGQKNDRGIDTRTLSTDNIESIEVVRGVASAEYGNMSAGAVIVKTKQGRTPYEVRVKSVPDTKAVALNKGFSLGADKGFLNVGLDYANAMKDIRTAEESFDRGTFSVGYSNTFNRDRTPFQFNAKVSGYLAASTTKPDPDNVSQDERKELNDRSLTVNLNGSWLLNKSWITSLKYVLSTTMTRQYAREMLTPKEHGVPNPGAAENGEYLAEFTPDIFLRDIRNLSMAYYTNAKLVAELSGRYGGVYNKAMAGVEWNNSGNTGKGLYYRGVRPIGFRPEPFSDIPFLNKVSLFVEDKATLPLGSTSLTLQAGGRFTYMATDLLKDKWAIDPRFNVKYTLISNRAPKKVREVSLRAGWGIQTTLPGLRMLYPFPVYDDRVSLSWGGTAETGPVAAWTTKVTTRDEMRNADLKMQYSKNLEAGVEFDLFGVRGSVVYYNEKMRNGYSFRQAPQAFAYREYDTYSGTEAPVYIDDPEHPGQLVLGVDGKPLEYTDVQVFRTPKKPANDNKYDKWGVEYTFDFGQIRPIRTSVVVNGAYMNMTNRNGQGVLLYDDPYSSVKIPIDGKNVYNPFIAGFIGGKSMNDGTQNQRFNSNVTLITHIPKLRLITSLTVQCVWLNRSRNLQPRNVYLLDEEGNPVYGDFSSGTDGRTLYKDPDYYMNAAGQVLPFSRELYEDPIYGAAYRTYLQSANSSNTYMENSLKPYFMANLRVTKEIGNLAQISFYANNFTDSRPKMKLRSSGTYVRVNTDIYFGVELKLKF